LRFNIGYQKFNYKDALGLNGAGLAFTFGRIDAFIEGRVQNVYTRNGGISAKKSIQTAPLSFGILVAL
jgi:hypothetical protein